MSIEGFPYFVEIPLWSEINLLDAGGNPRGKWCSENVAAGGWRNSTAESGSYRNTGYNFKNEDDAVLFALRFS